MVSREAQDLNSQYELTSNYEACGFFEPSASELTGPHTVKIALAVALTASQPGAGC